MTAQHTAGPWTIREVGPARRFVIESNGREVAITYAGDAEGDANAARIVACVNALEPCSTLSVNREDYRAICDALSNLNNVLIRVTGHELDELIINALLPEANDLDALRGEYL
jgi:hypothetical protein